MILSLKNFKKPLDIFSPQIERKRSEEYLVIILAVKESFERFSCLEFIFEIANTGKPAYKMKNINKDFQRHFNTCLRGWNCCLCICFTELFSFYWLLVVSFAIFIAGPFVFSRSWTSLPCRSSQNAARIKHFWRLHIVIKPLNKKNKHNKLFSMLKRITLLILI